MKVVFSPLAATDLLEIATYIAEDNPKRAKDFISQLEEKCLKLGELPSTGVARSELGKGIRMLPHGNYLIFYRADKATIRIERILHGARDIERLFV